MTNSTNDIQKETKVKGQKLGTVTTFKCLRVAASDDVPKAEIGTSKKKGHWIILLTLVKKRELRKFGQIKIFRLSKDNSAGHSDRQKKKR